MASAKTATLAVAAAAVASVAARAGGGGEGGHACVDSRALILPESKKENLNWFPVSAGYGGDRYGGGGGYGGFGNNPSNYLGEGGKGGHAWDNPSYNNDYQSSIAGSPGGAILRFPDNINYTATGSPVETADGSFKILQWPRTAGTYTITFT